MPDKNTGREPMPSKTSEKPTKLATKNDIANELIGKKPKKKRGRPSKKKPDDITSMKKKRGRKTKQFEQKPKIYKPKKKHDDIILCLRNLRMSDVAKYSKKKIGTKNNNKSSTLSGSTSTICNSSPDECNENIFTITDILSDNSSSEEYNDNNCSNDMIKLLKKKDIIIQKQKEKINEYKNIIDDNELIGINSKIARRMDLNLINITNGKNIVTSQTEIACWWCTYQFDTPPFFIPEKCINDTYHVYGCFCSLPCAMGFIVNISDYKVSGRISLLNKLYGVTASIPIIIAPNKYTFERFGGNLSIDEYRKNIKTNKKEYRLFKPPMVPIVPIIEESYINKQYKPHKDGLVLKRSTRLPNFKNTLENTMKIRKKK